MLIKAKAIFLGLLGGVWGLLGAFEVCVSAGRPELAMFVDLTSPVSYFATVKPQVTKTQK